MSTRRLGPNDPCWPRTSTAAVAPVATRPAKGAGASTRLTVVTVITMALSELLDEALELPQVAALVDAVAMDAVLGDDGVAGVPVAPWLGVQPIDVAGPVAQLFHDPRLGRVVVVAGVAQEDHRALGRDLGAPLVPEDLEGVAIVGVAVDPDDVGFGVHAVHRLIDVLGALEEPGDLVDPVDEDERTHA